MNAHKTKKPLPVYLIDTNVISEARKGVKADPGVRQFFTAVVTEDVNVFLSVVTVGELRRGIELIRHRGDQQQSRQLEQWLSSVLAQYDEYILDFDAETAQVWGRLRAPQAENALDKQIAATALIHDLIVVTRNQKDFKRTGVSVLNPFSA